MRHHLSDGFLYNLVPLFVHLSIIILFSIESCQVWTPLCHYTRYTNILICSTRIERFTTRRYLIWIRIHFIIVFRETVKDKAKETLDDIVKTTPCFHLIFLLFQALLVFSSYFRPRFLDS